MENYKKDRVLNYLADLLSEVERENFLSDLKTDSELAELYQTETKKLNSFEIPKSINEDYFTNLLPKVREKLDKKRELRWYQNSFAKYAIPFIFIIAVGINFINFDNESMLDNFSIFTDSSDYDLLLSSDNDFIDELLEEDYQSEDGLIEILDEENETNLISLNDFSDYSNVLENNNYIDQIDTYSISEEEIEEILKNLSSEETL